jgi:GNAT superfamily N-acetyltransferase
MDDLVDEADKSGHRFVARFFRNWLGDGDRFDGPDEQIVGIWADEKLVGFAGLHADPYLNDPAVCRLRHLYVASAFRDQGIGVLLVRHLLENARSFERVRLRAGTQEAVDFYDHIGWQKTDEKDATHQWIF